MTLGHTAARLVEQYGDQAYHKAVELSLLGFFGRGDNAARDFVSYSQAALELFHAGYHEYPKRELVEV